MDGKWITIEGNGDHRLDSLTDALGEKGAHVKLADGHCDKHGEEELPEKDDLFIYCTGNLPNFSKLTELTRKEWDELVNQFINGPAMWIQPAIAGRANDKIVEDNKYKFGGGSGFVPGGSDDPRLFKDAKGRIVIIGPDLPTGKKISGHERAKVEVFRGLLRPFVTTVNQELSDVLKSNVRVFLILPGTVDGKEPSNENIMNTINYLMSDEAGSSSEVIFCPDETR